jgi:hypothetical protein
MLAESIQFCSGANHDHDDDIPKELYQWSWIS